MTPASRARRMEWLDECRRADAELARQPLSVEQSTFPHVCPGPDCAICLRIGNRDSGLIVRRSA